MRWVMAATTPEANFRLLALQSASCSGFSPLRPLSACRAAGPAATHFQLRLDLAQPDRRRLHSSQVHARSSLVGHSGSRCRTHTLASRCGATRRLRPTRAKKSAGRATALPDLSPCPASRGE
jgi:hypothetical protein